MLNNLTKLLANSKSSTIDTQSVVYNFNKNRNLSINAAKENATILLKYFFTSISCLIGKPVFIISPKKVVIHLCFYKPGRVEFNNNLVFSTPIKATALNQATALELLENEVNNSSNTGRSLGKAVKLFKPNFKYLGFMLSQLFNKEVELELIPLKYPYLDSSILAQLIGLNSNKYNFNKMLAKLFKKAYIITNNNSSSDATNSINALMTEENGPVSQLTGIKIKIAGRLASQRIVPKSTVKTAYKGSLSSSAKATASGKIQNNFVDTASYTSKNKIGAYTVTVSLGHKITN